MKAAMKAAMKTAGKPITKAALVQEISEETGLNRRRSVAQCVPVWRSHGARVTEREMKKTGKITIQYGALRKTRRKPATKHGKSITTDARDSGEDRI